MKCLVTGAGGFIGSHLVEALIADGHDVVGIDIDGLHAVENLSAVETHARFRLVEADVRDEIAHEFLDGVDVVYHLAAKVGVLTAQRDGVAVLEWNTAATKAVVESVRRAAPTARVLYASSSEVYGDSEVQPLCEDAPLRLPPPTDPRWAYAYSKAADEALVLGLTAVGRIRGVVARLFNIVGTRQSEAYGAILPSFVRAVVRGESPIVHGDGVQTRTFCHMRHAVSYLRLIADRGEAGRIYNAGSTIEQTILSAARMVSARLRGPAPVHVSMPPTVIGCRRRVPDMSKTNALGLTDGRNWENAIDELAISYGWTPPAQETAP